MHSFNQQELAEHTAEVNVQHENLDGIFTFYDSVKATLYIYQVNFLVDVLHREIYAVFYFIPV